MMGLPRPVASVHNSWLFQKGWVLEQPIFPGSKKVQRRRNPGLGCLLHLSVSLSHLGAGRHLRPPLPPGAFSCTLGFCFLGPESMGFAQAHPLPSLCLSFLSVDRWSCGFQTAVAAGPSTLAPMVGEDHGSPKGTNPQVSLFVNFLGV